jgi:hypothetical protein
VSLGQSVTTSIRCAPLIFWTNAMDFFERYLSFSGGRGDGSLEALFVVMLGMLVLVTVSRYTNK